MKKPFQLFVLALLFLQCSTTKDVYDKTFQDALIGQNELVIQSRLGAPAQTQSTKNGGKIFVYEFDSKGMFITPNKSNITYSQRISPGGDKQGWTYTSNVNRATNDPQYTIYQTDVYYLKVFFNKDGECIKYEQNLTREQLELLYSQFKKYRSTESGS